MNTELHADLMKWLVKDKRKMLLLDCETADVTPYMNKRDLLQHSVNSADHSTNEKALNERFGHK